MTSQRDDQTDVGKSIAEALKDVEPTWITLPGPQHELPNELQAAIEDFDAGKRQAAIAACDWLRSHAVDSYQTSRTRLLIAEHRIAGFYSLAAAQVELRTSDRRQAGFDPVRVPAALVTWIAKDVRADIDGKLLLMHAAGTARRAAELQATAVLVLDPFDDQTEKMWRERFGFRASAEKRKPKRLWLPLEPVD